MMPDTEFDEIRKKLVQLLGDYIDGKIDVEFFMVEHQRLSEIICPSVIPKKEIDFYERDGETDDKV